MPALTSKTDHLWERKEPCLRIQTHSCTSRKRRLKCFPLGLHFFLIKKQWCGTFLLVLLVTGKLPSFLGYESKLPLVFWGEEKRKTIVILFQKFKRGCSDSNLSTSWEKFKMRADGSYSVPSSWVGRRIPGLHRRAASPGAAGWYNPWECRHLPQTHSVKSESGRKEDNVISKWESYKEVK